MGSDRGLNMKMKIILIFLLVYLISLWNVNADESKATLLEDCDIKEDSPNVNQDGGGTYGFAVWKEDTTSDRRGLIKFSLRPWKGKSITGATVCAYCDGSEFSDSSRLYIYSVSDGHLWDDDTVTWTNAPSADQELDYADFSENIWGCWDVTSKVQSSLSSHDNNITFMLVSYNQDDMCYFYQEKEDQGYYNNNRIFLNISGTDIGEWKSPSSCVGVDQESGKPDDYACDGNIGGTSWADYTDRNEGEWWIYGDTGSNSNTITYVRVFYHRCELEPTNIDYVHISNSTSDWGNNLRKTSNCVCNEEIEEKNRWFEVELDEKMGRYIILNTTSSEDAGSGCSASSELDDFYEFQYFNGTAEDTASPTISIVVPQNDTTSSNELNITFGETVDWGAYSIDGNANSTTGKVNEYNTTTSLSDGVHYVTVYANDSEGNMGSSTVYWTQDTTGPVFESDPVGGAISSNMSVEISTRVKDDTSSLDLVWIESNETGSYTNYTSTGFSSGGTLNIKANLTAIDVKDDSTVALGVTNSTGKFIIITNDDLTISSETDAGSSLLTGFDFNTFLYASRYKVNSGLQKWNYTSMSLDDSIITPETVHDVYLSGNYVYTTSCYPSDGGVVYKWNSSSLSHECNGTGSDETIHLGGISDYIFSTDVDGNVTKWDKSDCSFVENWIIDNTWDMTMDTYGSYLYLVGENGTLWILDSGLDVLNVIDDGTADSSNDGYGYPVDVDSRYVYWGGKGKVQALGRGAIRSNISEDLIIDITTGEDYFTHYQPIKGWDEMVFFQFEGGTPNVHKYYATYDGRNYTRISPGTYEGAAWYFLNRDLDDNDTARIRICANDSIGNVECTNYATVEIDDSALTLSLDHPTNTTYGTSTIDLNITETGANECWYILDGGSNTTITGCQNTHLTSVSIGSHYLQVYAKDTLTGNITSDEVYFYKRESIPPLLDTTTPLNSSYTYSANGIELNISYGEYANWTAYSLNGAANVTDSNISTWNTTLSLAVGNDHNLTLYANDSWGNMNSSFIEFDVTKKSTNAINYQNGTANSSYTYYRGQDFNLTVVCDSSTNEANFTLNVTGNTENKNGTESATILGSMNNSVYPSYNYAMVSKCVADENHTVSSTNTSTIILDPGIDFYVNSTKGTILYWSFTDQTFNKEEPVGQSSTVAPLCINNTQSGQIYNISVILASNTSELYNISLWINGTHYDSENVSEVTNQTDNWVFNNTGFNSPKCFWIWANNTPGNSAPYGTWSPIIYADTKVSTGG